MSNELIVIPKENALEVFTTSKGLDPIIEKIKAEVLSVIPDVSTKKGRDAIASNAAKVSRSKTYLDGIGKELVDKLKEQPKLIDAERKRVRDILDALRDEVRQPLTDYEEQEKQRIERIKERIEDIKFVPDQTGSDVLKNQLTELKKIEIDETFEEFKADAALAKMDTIAALEVLIEKTVREENERAELERLRKEAEERSRIERESQLIKEAEERAKKQAEEAAQKIINDAKLAEERAKAQAFEAQERERIAKEQEAARIEAAIKAEKMRAAEEQAAIKKAEEKRQADLKHRSSVINQAAKSLSELGYEYDLSEKIICLIADGKVSRVLIDF